MTDTDTQTDRFRACGEALYGSTWQTELAHALDMSPKSGIVRKMASGRARITPNTWRKLADLMRERAISLAGMVPVADPQDMGAEHIRHALLDPRDEVVAACLIGMGHWRLGGDLDDAADRLSTARGRLDDQPMRPVTEAEAAENPLLAVIGQTYVDEAAGRAAMAEHAEARARVDQLRAQAREIADDLDHGYDGAPC